MAFRIDLVDYHLLTLLKFFPWNSDKLVKLYVTGD